MCERIVHYFLQLHLKTVESDRLNLLEQEWKQKEAHRDEQQRQTQNRFSAMKEEILEERRNFHAQQKLLTLKEMKVRRIWVILHICSILSWLVQIACTIW